MQKIHRLSVFVKKKSACLLPLPVRLHNLWRTAVAVSVSLLFVLGGEAVIQPDNTMARAAQGKERYDEKFNPSLHMAVKEGLADKVHSLIAAGANVNARDYAQRNALHYAKDVSIIQALIAAGANVNARDNLKNTPLHYSKDINIVQALIAAGANVNAKGDRKNTPLHSISVKSSAVADALIAAGANVNAESYHKETPLHSAVRRWYSLPRYPSLFDLLKYIKEKKQWYKNVASVINALIAAGANVNARDSSGKTPLAYAKDDIVELLKKSGAVR